jgi:hypothetical protein
VVGPREIKVADVVCIELSYNGLYLPIYTLALRIRITLGQCILIRLVYKIFSYSNYISTLPNQLFKLHN